MTAYGTSVTQRSAARRSPHATSPSISRTPAATAANVAACRAAGKPLLIGTTGFACGRTRSSLRTRRAISRVLVAPNTSIGVSLLIELVQRCARRPCPPRSSISRSAKRITAEKGLRRQALRSRSVARPQRRAGMTCAEVGRHHRSGRRSRPERAISASPSPAAGTSSASTRCFLPAPESSSRSLTGPRIGRSLPGVRSRRQRGWRSSRSGRYAMRDVAGYKTESLGRFNRLDLQHRRGRKFCERRGHIRRPPP